MMAGALLLPGEAQRPPEAEVGVVVDRMGLDDRLEFGRGFSVMARTEEGAPEGLAYGTLLGGLPGRLLERHGGLLEITVLKQLHPTPVERIKGLSRLLIVSSHDDAV